MLHPGMLWKDKQSFSLTFQVGRPYSLRKKQCGKQIPSKGNVASHSERQRELQKGDQDLEGLNVVEGTKCSLVRWSFYELSHAPHHEVL